METPNHISQDISWNIARNALSYDFIDPITDQINEVIALAQYIDTLTAYDFKFATWEEFVIAEDKPEGLMERATEWKADYPEAFVYVVYDPLDDADGYLMITSNALELARITCEYISDMQPEDGPLGVDNAAKNAVEAR